MCNILFILSISLHSPLLYNNSRKGAVGLNESKHVLRDAQLRTLWIARIDYEKRNHVGTHVHDEYHQFLVLLHGDGEVWIGEHRYPLREGRYYLFPSGTSHGFRFTAKSSTIDIKFSIEDDRLRSLLNSLPGTGPCDPENVGELKQWFQLSLHNRRSPHPLVPYRIDSGFKGTLLSILHKSHSGEAAMPRESRPKTDLKTDFPMAVYLREHLAEKLCLQDIAQHFGFHPHYLIKLFNDHMGMSPMQYLQEIRLEKAREYLEYTKWSVSEISEKLGWTNSYFSRLFHQREGMSPSQYRKRAVSVVGQDVALESEFVNEWKVSSY